MLGRRTDRIAVVDPTRNRPQLVGRRLLRDPLDQAAVDDDLAYDALIVAWLGLRRLSERPTGEGRPGQKRGRSDRCDSYFLEHLHLLETSTLARRPAQGRAALAHHRMGYEPKVRWANSQ